MAAIIESVKEKLIDGVLGIQQTVNRFRQDPEYLQTPFGNINAILLSLGAWSLFTIVMSSLFHYDTSTGFATYALSISTFLYACGAAQVLNKQQEPILVGLVMGAGAMLSALSFSQASFLYGLSGCTAVAKGVDRFSCTAAFKGTLFNTAIYEFCIAFMTGVLAALIYTHRDVILAESPTYMEVGGSGGLDGFGHQNMEDTPLTYKKTSSGPKVAL